MRLITACQTLAPVTKTPERRIITLLVIVLVFLVCNITKLVVNTYDMVHYREIMACQAMFNYYEDIGFSQINTTTSRIGKKLLFSLFNLNLFAAEFFLLLNSCINFVIYVVLSSKFRRIIHRYFHSC